MDGVFFHSLFFFFCSLFFFSVPLVPWSFGPLVLWSRGPLVPWSFGPVVPWSSGSPGPVQPLKMSAALPRVCVDCMYLIPLQ